MTLNRVSFGPLYNSTLGFERFFHDVEKLLDSEFAKTTATSFPPHNILKTGENCYVVELAVAGFNKDEITITVDNGNLSIRGSKKDKDTQATYLYRGIGTRSFTKTLTIADTVEVRGAEFKDGILRIGLENIVPENKKPRQIEIDDELSFFSQQLLTEKDEVNV
jgi:molecular chaperone IbpA